MSGPQAEYQIEDPADYPIPMTRLEYVIDGEGRAKLFEAAMIHSFQTLDAEFYEEVAEPQGKEEVEWLEDASILEYVEGEDGLILDQRYNWHKGGMGGVDRGRRDDRGLAEFRDTIFLDLLEDKDYSKLDQDKDRYIEVLPGNLLDFSLLMEGQTNRTVLGHMVDGDKEWKVDDDKLDRMYEKYGDLVDLRNTILVESKNREEPRQYHLKRWADEMLSNFLDRTEEDIDYPDYIIDE